MGREGRVHVGGNLPGAVQAPGLLPDQDFAPLSADADPDRA